MKSRTKQVTSALSPTSLGPANAYPSINSAYWSAPSSNQPYVLPGLCCTYVKNKTKTKQKKNEQTKTKKYI